MITRSDDHMVILVPSPYRHNVIFYFSPAFPRSGRITLMTDVISFDLVSSKLSFSSGYLFIVFIASIPQCVV